MNSSSTSLKGTKWSWRSKELPGSWLHGPWLQSLSSRGLSFPHSSSGRSTSVWVNESRTWHFTSRVCLPTPHVVLQGDQGPGTNLKKKKEKENSVISPQKGNVNNSLNLKHVEPEPPSFSFSFFPATEAKLSLFSMFSFALYFVFCFDKHCFAKTLNCFLLFISYLWTNCLHCV